MDRNILLNLGIALFIGALLGIEREKRIAEKGFGIGGIRTFVLMAEAGAVSAWLTTELATPAIFVAALMAVSALWMAGYILQVRLHSDHAGLTTVVAAVATFLLGGLVMFGHRHIAVALAILNSALLAYRVPIHELVGRIDRTDLYAALKLLIASFIVLPLLPNRAVDPWGTLNPYRAWLLVVLISALSLLGYVAVRWLGPERGTAATGVFGGLVSSTAVSLAMARRSRDTGESDATAAGVALAWAVMFVRIVVIVAAAAPSLLRTVAPPGLLLAAVCAAAAAWWLRPSDVSASPPAAEVPLRNPFSLQAAARFAAVFVFISAAVHLVRQWAPAGGIFAVSALAGLTDVDAITLSLAESARSEPAGPVPAAIAIAAAANTVVKGGMVVALGARPLKARIAGLALLLLALLGLAAARAETY